jgi:hypothetical protein
MFRIERCTDARGSNTNSVGGDQRNYTINLIINGSLSERERSRLLRDIHHLQQSPIPAPEIPAVGGLLTGNTGSTNSEDVASNLIDKIQELLADRTELTDNDRALRSELETLRQILFLIGLAVQTFEYTPLGQNLAKSINPQVEQCCEVLQNLFDSIRSCRQGLFPTYIWSLWRAVWWSGCEIDGQASLRVKLSAHRMLLGKCLRALNS